MNTFQRKAACLSLAAALLFTGCGASQPDSVGAIGGVEIPAGIYKLAQYNAYNTTASAAQLEDGQTAQDVDAVLKAECTGVIGNEQVTLTGEEYIARVTMRSIEYYAAVETSFAELNGTLTEDSVSEAADTAESLYTANEKLYKTNGITQQDVNDYLLNAEKAQAILTLTYGPDGTDPVTDEEYTAYLQEECYYLETIQLPLVDYTTYTAASDAEKAKIQRVAGECQQLLNETAGNTSSDALYTAAMTYVPQAATILGSEIDVTTALYYAGSDLYTRSDLALYEVDGVNLVTGPLDAAAVGEWVQADLGSAILVMHRLDPLESISLDTLVEQYDLLTTMKSGQVQSDLYARGASLDHALDQSAMKAYAASRITKTV